MGGLVNRPTFPRNISFFTLILNKFQWFSFHHQIRSRIDLEIFSQRRQNLCDYPPQSVVQGLKASGRRRCGESEINSLYAAPLIGLNDSMQTTVVKGAAPPSFRVIQEVSQYGGALNRSVASVPGIWSNFRAYLAVLNTS